MSGKEKETKRRGKERVRFFPLRPRSSSFSLGLSHTRCSLLVVVLAIAAPASAQDFGAARSRAAKDNARFDPTFKKYSKRFFGVGFDWRYFKAQAMAESELDPNSVSNVGARGLMQLMPSTFGEISSKRPEFTNIDDPEWNIAAGILHDRYLFKLWRDSLPEEQVPRFAFGSYNAGEGTIKRAATKARLDQLDHHEWESIVKVAPSVPRWRYRETVDYVRTIDANYRKLVAKSGAQ